MTRIKPIFAVVALLLPTTPGRSNEWSDSASQQAPGVEITTATDAKGTDPAGGTDRNQTEPTALAAGSDNGSNPTDTPAASAVGSEQLEVAPAEGGTAVGGQAGDESTSVPVEDSHQRILHVLNADGSPAAGAKVLESPFNIVPIIYNGRLALGRQRDEMRGEFGVSDEMLPLSHLDPDGRLVLPRHPRSFGGGGMGGIPAQPARLVLGANDEYGFLPADSAHKRLHLRRGAKLKVNLSATMARSGEDYVVLAWWNNGYALPNHLGNLGFRNIGEYGAGWKFQPSFYIFQTAILSGDNPFGDDGTPRARLVVPPGEVRLTLVSADQLVSAIGQGGTSVKGSENIERDAAKRGSDISYDPLVNLSLYGGPSQIVSVIPGEDHAVSFDECEYSLQLRMHGQQYSLPAWGDTSEETLAVYLIRHVDVPERGDTEIRPGSPTHESLLASSRPLRSQLPPVRIGRRVSGDTYRFDLLRPGSYEVRVGTPDRALVMRTANNDYSNIGEAVDIRRVEPTNAAGTDQRGDPFGGAPMPAGIATYEIGFGSGGGERPALLMVGPELPGGSNVPSPPSVPLAGADPFASSGSSDDPFGEANPFAGPVQDPFANSDPFAPAAGQPPARSAPTPPAVLKPSTKPSLSKPSPRQTQLRALRARIELLQKQLDRATELLDRLEATE